MKRFTNTWPLGLSMAIIATFVGGCGTDEVEVNPAPKPNVATGGSGGGGSTDAASDAPVGSDASPDTGSPDAGPVVREVTMRDPLGNLDPANMLHDGDFELSGLDAIQYPWLGIEQSYIRTGATCRSGLRCLQMPKGHYVIGMFVWPDAPFVEISFYGKPDASQDCETEGIGLVLMLDQQGGEIQIGPETPEPVDGWCRYAKTLDVPQEPGYHYWGMLIATRSEAQGSMTFDEASMVGRMQSGTQKRSTKPLSVADGAWLERMRKEVKELLPPNPPYRPTPVDNPTGRRSK